MPDRLNLVFDLDGTLIDSAPQIHDTANKVFGAKGLPEVSFATVKGFIGNGVHVLVQRLMAHHALAQDETLQAELVVTFVSIYEQAFDLTVLYPGVLTELDELSGAGHGLAICTNKPEGPARAVLRHFGMDLLFPVIIGGDTLTRQKPDPAPLVAALDRLGKGKALFVGDSEVDADTALAANVPFALFTEGYRKAAPEALGAKLIFDDFAAFPRLVGHLAPRL